MQTSLHEAANTTATGENAFDKMTIVQRIKAVDAVIDEFIRPMLIMDGGNMEIIDIKENLDKIDKLILLMAYNIFNLGCINLQATCVKDFKGMAIFP